MTNSSEYNRKYYQEHKEEIYKKRKERGQTTYEYQKKWLKPYMREYMRAYRKKKAELDKKEQA